MLPDPADAMDTAAAAPGPRPGDGASSLPTWALDRGVRSPRHEWVAEEVPVAMVYNGISHAVMLASPRDLEDFALGFSLSEGIIDGPDDLLDFDAEPADLAAVARGAAPGQGVSLQLRVTLRCFMRLKERRRTLAGRTGCGLCGTESLAEAVRPVGHPVAALQVAASALHPNAFATVDG